MKGRLQLWYLLWFRHPTPTPNVIANAQRESRLCRRWPSNACLIFWEVDIIHNSNLVGVEYQGIRDNGFRDWSNGDLNVGFEFSSSMLLRMKYEKML